ncbi:MAG: phenylacetate--CoA ligase family protein [Acidobacteria bacterium]|nr:phenylacetate--CoA ligase family protein [Acidobacteriota bacterium]
MSVIDRIYGLYRRTPVALQNLMVSGYGWALHRRRYGPEHDATLAFLLETRSWDRERLRALELERLRETLTYAARHVPYYRELWQRIGFDPLDVRDFADLQQVPPTEKAEVKADPWRFVSEEYHRRKLFKGNTSGTTGKPLTTYKDRGCYQRVWAYQTRQRLQWGITGKGPRVSIGVRPVVPMSQSRPPYWRHDWTEDNWLFSNFHMSEATLDSYVAQIAQIDPEEINAYPSGVYLVAAHALRRGVTSIRPRAVVTCAETLYSEQRQVIETAFQCRVADQFGAAEVVFWVGQCPHGTYHISPEFGHLEIVEPGGTAALRGAPGDVLGTGFVNRAQVLVRYRIGDSAVMPERAPECPCGWQTPALDLLVGRIDDILFTPDGRALGRLDIVLKKIDGVLESQLVQDAPDHLTINLTPEAQPVPAAETTIAGRIRELFGPDMRVDFCWVAQIPRTAAGKFRYQINLVKNRPGTPVIS